jgi:hypothetical protein
MLNKPYINYIDIKIMNNISRTPTELPYNDMFINPLPGGPRSNRTHPFQRLTAQNTKVQKICKKL